MYSSCRNDSPPVPVVDIHAVVVEPVPGVPAPRPEHVLEGGQPCADQRHHTKEEGYTQKRRQRLSLLVKGQCWFNFLSHYSYILHQYDLKKRMNRITATWRNGCLKKWSSGSNHTKPTPTKMDVCPKICHQIFLAAKWLVRHSCKIVHAPTSSDDLCLPFCMYPAPWTHNVPAIIWFSA